MTLFSQLKGEIQTIIKNQFDVAVPEADISLQETKSDFEGNYTLVVFQLLRHIKGNPVQIGTQIGEQLREQSDLVTDFNVVKGFLNLTIADNYWIDFVKSIDQAFWKLPATGEKIVLEYTGPNTNKPLHLGHVRNMLIGWSLAEILQQAGNEVHKVNIYNDRGIAICKSMVAWQQFGNGETPESSGLKGDHFVGKFYVKYAAEEAREAQPIIDSGVEKREAVKQTPINQAAQKMLQDWEAGNEEVISLWKTMNGWVYEGFNETYKAIGVDFEKDYLESQTYKLGKDLVEQGLVEGKFYQKEDNSIWADLEDAGLDQKLLLRSDGTSVYITQDIATAQLRYNDYEMDRSIYVVGNEQDYHFQVLKEVLKKLEKPFAEGIQHLSYGMVDLPSGKMKSREGTVVDADELVEEMVRTAREKTEELGKIDNFSEDQKENLFRQIGLAALKFFILRVDPKRRMLFNPEESIDFQGFTGPFVQYTHARIQSLLSKVEVEGATAAPSSLEEIEIQIAQHLHGYQDTLRLAAENFDSSAIAKYAFDLAKLFNQFYAHVPVSKEENDAKRNFRIQLARRTADAIKISLRLLGIESPEQM